MRVGAGCAVALGRCGVQQHDEVGKATGATLGLAIGVRGAEPRPPGTPSVSEMLPIQAILFLGDAGASPDGTGPDPHPGFSKPTRLPEPAQRYGVGAKLEPLADRTHPARFLDRRRVPVPVRIPAAGEVPILLRGTSR